VFECDGVRAVSNVVEVILRPEDCVEA
jgi:hypothetical protein